MRCQPIKPTFFKVTFSNKQLDKKQLPLISPDEIKQIQEEKDTFTKSVIPEENKENYNG